MQGADESPNPKKRRMTVVLATFGGIVLAAIGFLNWQSRQLARTITATQYALATSDWSEAKSSAEAWAADAPNDGDAWIALAEATRQLKQFDQTAEALGKVPANNPRYIKVLELRGDLLLSELGRPLAAIENWRQMLAIKPDHQLAHQRLIYVFALTQQRGELVSQIQEAISRNCETDEAYLYYMLASNLQFSDGYLRITEWRRAHSDNPALEVAQAIYASRIPPSKSMSYFGEATIDAPKMLDECLQKYPQNPEILAFVMDREISNGEVDSLRARLEKLPETTNSDHRFWRFRGWLAMAEQRSSEAISAYETSLKLYPFDWRARHALATTLRLSNQPAHAEIQASLASRGKSLESQLLHLPNTASLTPQLLMEMESYARDCGDETVAPALKSKLTKSR